MGIDYYSCDHCGDSFPGVRHHVWCDCGMVWCSDECADADGYNSIICKRGFDIQDGIHPETHEECYKYTCEDDCESECEDSPESNCKYCRKEDYSDTELLRFAMQYFQIDRFRLINLLNKTNKEE